MQPLRIVLAQVQTTRQRWSEGTDPAYEAAVERQFALRSAIFHSTGD